MRGGGFDRAGVLPGPADQFCVYEGHYPLAYFLPTGYGEQIAPLLPDENGGEGIGAYQTMEGISGHVTLSVASCRHGLAPKSLTAVARTVLDLSNRSTTGMPFGLRIIGRTPPGTAFSLAPERQNQPTCLFILPDVVLPGLRPIPGVRVAAGASSATLSVPATYPWGVYQIFQTLASPTGTCPAAQLRGDSVLLGGPWVFGRWKRRMESEGQPTAGSGLPVSATVTCDIEHQNLRSRAAGARRPAATEGPKGDAGRTVAGGQAGGGVGGRRTSSSHYCKRRRAEDSYTKPERSARTRLAAWANRPL